MRSVADLGSNQNMAWPSVRSPETVLIFIAAISWPSFADHSGGNCGASNTALQVYCGFSFFGVASVVWVV